jgi:hypothetical protein
MEASSQPIYTDCDSCGSVDHLEYDCPCNCHGDADRCGLCGRVMLGDDDIYDQHIMSHLAEKCAARSA